jgi:hypothetical protein
MSMLFKKPGISRHDVHPPTTARYVPILIDGDQGGFPDVQLFHRLQEGGGFPLQLRFILDVKGNMEEIPLPVRGRAIEIDLPARGRFVVMCGRITAPQLAINRIFRKSAQVAGELRGSPPPLPGDDPDPGDRTRVTTVTGRNEGLIDRPRNYPYRCGKGIEPRCRIDRRIGR